MKTNQRYVLFIVLIASLAIGGISCSREAKRDRHLKRADRYFDAKQYDSAVIEYLNALRLGGTNSLAIRRLGTIYFDRGQIAKAFPFLIEAEKLEPNDLDVRSQLGSVYFTVRDFAKARAEAEFVLRKNPENEKALLMLSDTSLSEKEITATKLQLEQMLQKASNKGPFHLALGSLYLRQRDLTAAESSLKQAQVLMPESSICYVGLAQLYLAQTNLQLADQAFQKADQLAGSKSETQLRYADFMLRTGRVQDAKKILEEITRKAPDYLPAWTLLMQVAFADRNYEDCAALVKKVLARDQANFEALLLRGRVKLAKGEGAEAVAEFERMKAIYGRAPQVQYQLALAHLLNNDMTKAVGSLNQALALEPKFAEAILLLAELDIRKANSAPAITSLTQLVKQQPQIAQAHLLLATAYLAQKNLNEAVAVYGRMMGLFPKNPEIPLLMGIVFVQEKKLTDARKAFEKSLELSPDYLLALEQLVDLDLLENQYAIAFERVRKETEKNPKAAGPNLLLAKIHMVQANERVQKETGKNTNAAPFNVLLAKSPLAQRDMNQAEAALVKAIELDPNIRTPYLLLAQIYVALNKQQEALGRLAGLAKTNDVAALMLSGTIHDQLKSFVAARDAYERLLTVDPRYSPALNNLAYLYSEHFQQLDKAFEMAEKARQLLPFDPSTADTLGWILCKKGEYPRALSLLLESAEKLPADPEIQFHLGTTHYLMGEVEPARIALQRALQGNKDFPGKEEGNRRLALLAIDVKTAGPAVVAELEKRLRDEPNDAVALALLAAIYERDGAVEKAVKTFERARKQNPQNAQVIVSLAQLYSIRLNDQRKALELAKDAHGLAPEDAYISHTLGRLAYQAGDYSWASSLLQESARKLSHDPDVLYDLAWSCYSVGRIGEAETSMRNALQTGAPFSKSDEAKRFLAMIAANKNIAQAQVASPQVQKILTADPNYVPALMVSALLQEQRGNYQEAKQLYDKALDRYPLFLPATRQLAVLYADRLGDDQKAYPLAVKAREAFPEDPQLARTLGTLAYRRGDYARSAQLLKESSRVRTDDAELLYYLGMAHYKLREPKESKVALQRALSLNVETKFANEAKRVIGELK